LELPGAAGNGGSYSSYAGGGGNAGLIIYGYQYFTCAL
jgi:hypothetical protein